jgi:large subunit ribosomal protein L25
MATHVQLRAETRELLGKKVGRLRRAGILPATVYGQKTQPQSIQIRALELRGVMRQSGRTQLIDLMIDEQPARPVLIRQTSIDPKRNTLIHVEFFQPNLLERMTTHVPVHFVGESPAVKEGGIFLPVLDHVDIESLPDDVPAGGIEVDISQITEINGAIHAGQLEIPEGITLLTPPDEVVAKVNPQVAEQVVEEIIAEAEPLPAELGGEETPPDAIPEA